MQGVLKKLNGVGAKTFNAGDKLTFDLTQIRNLFSFGNLFPYLRTLLIELDLSILNSTGGTITIDQQKLYDVLVGCKLTLKSADKILIELTLSAGQALMWTAYFKGRRYPEVWNLASSVLTITNGSTGTVNLKLPIDFFDLRLREPEDEMIYAELLNGSEIEFTWCGASCFGSNTTITAATALRLSAEVVPRNEQRFPTLTRLREENLTGLAQEIALNGTFPLDIILEPVNAAAGGQTQLTFAVADITSVKLTSDGVLVVDSVVPQTLTTQWNRQLLTSYDRLGSFEAGSNRVLPIVWPSPSSGKKSKTIFARGKPYLELTGAVTITNVRVLERYMIPSGQETARRAFALVGINVAPNELVPKSTVKSSIMDPVTAMTTPWKIKRVRKAA